MTQYLNAFMRYLFTNCDGNVGEYLFYYPQILITINSHSMEEFCISACLITNWSELLWITEFSIKFD